MISDFHKLNRASRLGQHEIGSIGTALHSGSCPANRTPLFDEQRDDDEGDNDQRATADKDIAKIVPGMTRAHGLLVGFGHDGSFVGLGSIVCF